MNFRLFQTFALSLLIFSCSPSPEKQAQVLIKKSIEAHQISKKWDKVSNIKFKKWTRLMNESGEIESESDQWVEFRLKPYFEAKLTWTKDSILHVVNFNGSKISYQMGANIIQNEGFLKAKRAEIDAAFFAFAQPWNLLDEHANLVFEGQKTLKGGKAIESIRVDYGPESDVWWFYFDPVTAQLVANELHAKDHKSLIENVTFDKSTGFIFAQERKSFRIDDSGEKLFLRAEYLYSDYEITFE